MFLFLLLGFGASKFNLKKAIHDVGKKFGAIIKDKAEDYKVGDLIDKGIDQLTNYAVKRFKSLGPFIEQISVYLKKYLRHKYSSIYADPVEIDGIDKETITDVFTAEELESIIEPIAYEFGIDGDQISSYFDQVKAESESRRAFNTFNLSIKDDPRYRQAEMATTMIKVTKNGNEYNAHVKKVKGTANIIANTNTKEGQKADKDWRALDSDEIDDVFDTLKEELKSDVEQMKKE